MYKEWIDEYKIVNENAINSGWFVSPLEYFWPDGAELFGKIFAKPISSNDSFDRVVAQVLFKNSLNIHFRAQMMVLGYMKQSTAKSMGLEIENGLISLYKLDYPSAISQWMYLIEGYTRKLFKIKSTKSLDRKNEWKIPKTDNSELNILIDCLSNSLKIFLLSVLFKPSNTTTNDSINRHVLLHGNAENKKIFSQKNCLILMFCLDALLVIEMIENGVFPAIFKTDEEDERKISQREHLYSQTMSSVFEDVNLLKYETLNEHN